MKVYTIFLLLSFVGCIYCQKLKVCAYPDTLKKCDQLIRGNAAVECVTVQDSVDCAWKIQDGTVDFGVFYPEQALLVSKFVDQDLAVISELRDVEAESQKHSYKTVVVVKSSHEGGIKGFKGKSYCHMGFDDENAMTLRAEQEFENELVNIQEKCTNNKTVIEKEVEQYSKLFAKACRPGTWADDEDLEKRLKNTYKNLCELCDNPTECTYNDNRNPGVNALKCLTNNGVDVAYTTANAVDVYFQSNSQKGDYKLLCRNGDLKELNFATSDECTWRNQPWTVIMAKREKYTDVRSKLNEWIEASFIISKSNVPRRTQADWHSTLKDILTNSNRDKKFFFVESDNYPDQYFSSNNQALAPLKQNSQCELRWCTVSVKEQDKCNWLSAALDLQGIKPKINCFQGNHVFDCLRKIKENTVDAMAIDSHYGYLARKYAAVRTLMNFEERLKDTSVVFTVIKDDSGITNYSDLRGKKACFPEYRGLGWLAFIQYARELNEIPADCDFGKSIGNYFNGVCAPGVDERHYKSTGADAKKLCSLCKKRDTEEQYCPADDLNRYYNNNGSFACLKEGIADVAFVEVHELEGLDLSGTKILCRDGTFAETNIQTLTDECSLIATVNSEIVSKATNIGNQDFKEILQRVDFLFGETNSPDETFNVFASFKGEDNLLFKSDALGIRAETTGNIFTENYQKLFEYIDKCFITTTTSTTTTTMATTYPSSASTLSPISTTPSGAIRATITTTVLLCMTYLFI